MPYLDLTHPFTNKMPFYPGDEPPELKQIATIAKDGCNNYQVTTNMHIGTHMDGPLHMIANGKKLSDISVERFFGRGKLIDARGKSKIGEDLLANVSIEAGDIILIMTGFARHFGEPVYYEKYPVITEAFAQKIIEHKVKIVAMDTPSPDREPFKIHKLLLTKEILIIENLVNLEHLMGVAYFEIIALPVKFEADSAPVRVVAIIK